MIRAVFTAAIFAAAAFVAWGAPQGLAAHPTGAHETANTHIYIAELDQEFAAEDPENDAELQLALDLVVAVVEQRLSKLNIPRANVIKSGPRGLTVTVMGDHDPGIIRDILGLSNSLEFGILMQEVTGRGVAVQEQPNDIRLLPMPDGLPPAKVQILKGLDEACIASASVGVSQLSDEAVVNLAFDEEGKRVFAEFTAANVDKAIAVILNGKVILTPIIREPIYGGLVQLSGGFTQESAQMLVNQLSVGALPVPVRIVKERVSP